LPIGWKGKTFIPAAIKLQLWALAKFMDGLLCMLTCL
jgi:hypothetical protein